jgi:hypothetical protein
MRMLVVKGIGSVFTHDVAEFRWKSADVQVTAGMATRDVLKEDHEGYIVI